MRGALLIVTAALIALPLAANAVTVQRGVYPSRIPADLPKSYISEMEFNVGESGLLARTFSTTGDSRRSSSAAFNFELASVQVPLPVSVVLMLAAFGGLAFLSHRRLSALA